VDAEPQGFHENPAVNQALTQAVTYEMIAVRAYFLAENRQSNGHPGDHDADWLEAERQLQTIKWEGSIYHNKALVKLDVSASVFEKKFIPPSGLAVARPVVSRKGGARKAKGN
jgi:hypothetical protein